MGGRMVSETLLKNTTVVRRRCKDTPKKSDLKYLDEHGRVKEGEVDSWSGLL